MQPLRPPASHGGASSSSASKHSSPYLSDSRRGTAPSTAIPRPRTAAPRIQSHSSKSAFLSYSSSSSAASQWTAGGEQQQDDAVPFSLLDAIALHKQRARALARSRPSTARGPRRPAADEQDDSSALQSLDVSVSPSSSSSPLMSGRKSQQRRYRQSEEREASIRAQEERQEPEEAKLQSWPSSQPRHDVHSASVQQCIHLLRAPPLLSLLLPAFARIDSCWHSVIVQQRRVSAQEAESMRRLREEEQRWRDAMLLFMRVSVEYRRTELHLPDGRLAAATDSEQQRAGPAEAEEDAEDAGSAAATRAWLISDDDQRDSMAVDWSGRYWQSERMREKEAWYRVEERQAQSGFQRGLGLLTKLYDRSFQQLLLFADDTKAHGKSQSTSNSTTAASGSTGSLASPLPALTSAAVCVARADDEECQRLRFELQEILTALSPPAASSASVPSSEPSPSALLPPRHPSLTAYSHSLHLQLSSLSSLLSSHHHRVFSLIERCHALTRASSSLDDLLSSLHEDERERRDEIEHLKRELADAKGRKKEREAEWEERLRRERLETWKERELRSRAEQQTQALHDTLQRIQSMLDSDSRRRQDVKDAHTQCEADNTRQQQQQQRAAPGLHLSLPGDDKEPAAAADARVVKRRSLVVKPAVSRQHPRLERSSPPQSPRSPRSASRSPVSPRSPAGGGPASGGAAARGATSVAAALSAASRPAAAGGERGERGRTMAAMAARSLTRSGKDAATEGKGKEAETSPPHREGESPAAQSAWSVSIAAAQLADDKRWDGLPFL